MTSEGRKGFRRIDENIVLKQGDRRKIRDAHGDWDEMKV